MEKKNFEYEIKISKWGGTLAVRLPADLVRKFNLEDGDSAFCQTNGNKTFINFKKKYLFKI